MPSAATFAIWAVLGGLTGGLCGLGVRRAATTQRDPATWERRLWTWGLVVAALVYLGFAAAGGAEPDWWLVEAAGVLVYGMLAWSSERFGRWLLALGWLAHIGWDAGVHGSLPAHVPGWYVPACAGFDFVVGLGLLALALPRSGTPESSARGA